MRIGELNAIQFVRGACATNTRAYLVQVSDQCGTYLVEKPAKKGLACVCNNPLILLYMASTAGLARVQTMSMWPNSCKSTPSRPGTQPLVMLLCGFFWRSNRNHYLLVLVMRALATFTHVRMYLPKFNKNKGTIMIPTAVPWGFFYSK